MSIKLIILFLLVAFCAGLPIFADGVPNPMSEMEANKAQKMPMNAISLIQLLSSPKKYKGREIAVDGYLEHADNGKTALLFLTKDYADNLVKGGAVPISFRQPGPWILGSFQNSKDDKTFDERMIEWDKDFSWPRKGTGAYVCVIGTYEENTKTNSQSLTNVWFVCQHINWSRP